MAESNSWEYFQKISATKHPTRSLRTWYADQISRTCFSRCRHSLASFGWIAISQLSRPMDVDTKHCPHSLCLCGWVISWFDQVDPSDLLTWHRPEPWTNWVFHRWSRQQLTPCSNLLDKCLLVHIYTIWN